MLDDPALAIIQTLVIAVGFLLLFVLFLSIRKEILNYQGIYGGFFRRKKKTSLFTAVSPTTKQCPVRVVIWATGKDLPLLSFCLCFKFPLVL